MIPSSSAEGGGGKRSPLWSTSLFSMLLLFLSRQKGRVEPALFPFDNPHPFVLPPLSPPLSSSVLFAAMSTMSAMSVGGWQARLGSRGVPNRPVVGANGRSDRSVRCVVRASALRSCRPHEQIRPSKICLLTREEEEEGEEGGRVRVYLSACHTCFAHCPSFFSHFFPPLSWFPLVVAAKGGEEKLLATAPALPPPRVDVQVMVASGVSVLGHCILIILRPGSALPSRSAVCVHECVRKCLHGLALDGSERLNLTKQDSKIAGHGEKEEEKKIPPTRQKKRLIKLVGKDRPVWKNKTNRFIIPLHRASHRTETVVERTETDSTS